MKVITFETALNVYSGISVIGEGGAGRVYKVVDEAGKNYAIKMLDKDKANSEKLNRFKNEIYFCVKNRHQNIITILDHGVFVSEEDRMPFFVMHLYPASLRILMSGEIPVDKILFYYVQLLNGVEAAHRLGVFHRDLKPENILFDSENDNLMIADFGIAHFTKEELFTLVETKQNTRLANFQYAAPEQRARGQQVDHMADIYALGLILNEMFTGEIPQGTKYKTISSVAPHFEYLDDLVAEMLSQSPDERPPSIGRIKQVISIKSNEFLAQQRLSELKNTVIPATEIDDPLITDPVRLVGFDWDNNILTLVLSQSVNDRWVYALRNMGRRTSVSGKGPAQFTFSDNKAKVSANEKEIQRIIDYFKQWLPKVTEKYKQMIIQEQRKKEADERREIQQEIEYQEQRARILRDTEI